MPRVTENDLTRKPKVRSRKNRGPWFRAYADDVYDERVQLLPIALRWRWFELSCLAAKEGGTLPSNARIAYRLRMDAHDVESTVCELIKAGLVEQTWSTGEPQTKMAGWRERQYVADRSTGRVRKFRQRKHDETFHGTVSETVMPYSPSSTVSRSETESYDHPRNEAAGDAVRQDRGASVAVRLRQGIGGKNDGGNFNKGGN